MLLILGGVGILKSGKWLVAGDRFDKVAWTVVLAGESRDAERTEAALKLYMDGRIDTVIYSATRVFKDRYGSEFMVDYMARQGFPREKLFEYRQDLYSTREEARELIRQFRFQNLDTVLIITSNYHSARTRKIFRKLAQGYPHILVHPAPFDQFDPEAWWSSREGRKYWLLEWSKTVATYFELMGDPPETGKAESSGLLGASSPVPTAVELRAVLPDSIPPAVAPDSAISADSASNGPQDSAGLHSSTLPPSGEGQAGLADSTAKSLQVKPANDTLSAPAPREVKTVAKPAGAKSATAARAAPASKESTVKKETKSSGKDTAPGSKASSSSKPSSKKTAEKDKEKPKKKATR